MLHYKNREQKVQIITLNPILASDVYDRLHNYPSMESVKLVLPGDGKSEIKVRDIENIAHDTTKSAILIIDVCSWTRAKLQSVYSDIIRFNRPDFNRFCYSILIGDSPMGYNRGQKPDGIHRFLSELRVDFNPAVFFTSPFSLYSSEEKAYRAAYSDELFPERIPQRFGKYFAEQLPSFKRLSVYFRAAYVPDDIKLTERKKRQEVLKKLCIKMAKEDFPAQSEQLIKGLSKEGYAMPGESLRINIYPFFFEEWVSDLMRKVESAVQ
jgi:hypothetical protein